MDWTYTTISILVGILSVLLSASVGWQVWSAISLDSVRGKLSKRIDDLKKEVSDLSGSLVGLRSQVDRENEIRWWHWYWFERYKRPDHYEDWSDRMFSLVMALEKIAPLCDITLPPEEDRVWSHYMLLITEDLAEVTDDWTKEYDGAGMGTYDLNSVYRALERMDAYPMDSEAMFFYAREYIKKAAKRLQNRLQNR